MRGRTAKAIVVAWAAAVCFGWLVLLLADRAASEPAVSAVNGKLTTFGGSFGAGEDDDGTGGVAGSLTLPLGYVFGAQVDGAWARMDEYDFADAGLHLFWRNPASGLLGAYLGYAHHTGAGGQDVGRAGVEAQYFVGQLTLDGAGGVRFGDVESEAYGSIKLDYYLTEDFKISGGYAYEGDSFAVAGTEYQLITKGEVGAALFTETYVNSPDSYSVLAGVKVYIGRPMSLIDRHRKQDPDSYATADQIATLQAVQQSRRSSRPQSSGQCTAITAAADPCDRAFQCYLAGFYSGPAGPSDACGCEAALDQCLGPCSCGGSG